MTSIRLNIVLLFNTIKPDTLDKSLRGRALMTRKSLFAVLVSATCLTHSSGHSDEGGALASCQVGPARPSTGGWQRPGSRGQAGLIAILRAMPRDRPAEATRLSKEFVRAALANRRRLPVGELVDIAGDPDQPARSRSLALWAVELTRPGTREQILGCLTSGKGR